MQINGVEKVVGKGPMNQRTKFSNYQCTIITIMYYLQ